MEDIIYDAGSDSEIITVAARPGRVRQTKRPREPLDEVDPAQCQNKRQRLLDCVLIPKQDQAYFSTLKQVSHIDTVHARSHSIAEDTSVLREEEVVDGLENRSASNNGRPRRSAARTSYVELTNLRDESGDEYGDELLDHRPPRKPRRKPKGNVASEESDFEGVEDHSSADDVGGSDGLASSDSDPSVQSEDAFDDEEPGTSGRKPAKSKISTGADNVVKKPAATKASRDKMLKLFTRAGGKAKGLNTGLPPLFEISDIFEDITSKALKLGLTKAVKHLGKRPLRIATMCSGSESPLLAVEMVRDSLKARGREDFEVDHLFSVEIEPFKQAYIERNFSLECPVEKSEPVTRVVRSLVEIRSRTKRSEGSFTLIFALEGNTCVSY